MSTPDQPDTPPLTRKQIRELRNTGATPVITPDLETPAEAAPEAPDSAPAPEEATERAETPAHVAPLPRAAEPTAVPPAPGPDAGVDLGASPLTRRQARQQERIRTASVPVITPDFAAAHTADAPADSSPTTAAADPISAVPAPSPDEEHVESEPVETVYESSLLETTTDEPAAGIDIFDADADVDADPEPEPERSAEEDDRAAASEEEADEQAERAVLNPMFGAQLLAADSAPVALPPSFDQLIARDTATTGSVATPHALIVSQAPSDAPLVAPVAATGEVLVTGTFALPEGLGSTGHAPGVADGKDIDATLIDGELPAHSSPTPIAASAAISTVKTSDEIIRPPAPEKGSKLMLTLAITAGVLALALVGVLVYALVTGVFS